MTTVPPAPRAVVALGDFGHERCGVGGSVAAVVSAQARPVAVLDTAAPGIARFARAARALARRGTVCVCVYPTRSTFDDPGLLARVLIAWAVVGRRSLRFQLHEYRNLRRKLKWPVASVLPLASRIVVTSDSERNAVRRSWFGLVGRWCDVVVAIPTNGAAPTVAEIDRATAPAVARQRTVGIFGMRRDDKEVRWLHDVLAALDARFDRLVVAGGGWDDVVWPAAVGDRYEVVVLGHVARAALPDVFREWGVAVAPLYQPAHDGRMSVRTPLAFGVPTITTGPRDRDLTIDVPHLFLVPPTDVAAIDLDGIDRRAGALAVAAFEERVANELADALFGDAVPAPA